MLPLMMTVAVRRHEEATGRPLANAERDRLTALFAEHHQVVWRVLRRSGLDRSRADDGVQQVFLVALRRLSELRDELARGFLCGCAVMVARKMRQTSTREQQRPALVTPAQVASPDAHVELRQQVTLLDTILAGLEDELRAVFVLQVVEGLSKRETALALGLPEGTVATRLRRAREAFEKLRREATGGGSHE